jgi:NAD(P)-dependent dehydrogenase (short-subunit alcohol dehydrogenase family)
MLETRTTDGAPMSTFQGKTAIVTGGASGIGLALGAELARGGARVILVDRNGPAVIQRAAELRAEGHTAEGCVMDVCDAAAFDALVADTVEQFDRLDYLFNIAGVGIAGEFRDIGREHWDDVLKNNLQSTIHGCRAAYPHMVRQGQGHIVNMSSLGGVTPFPGSIPYAVSKFAIVGLSVSLRAEGAGLGVCVSVVCPGPVKTALLDSSPFIKVDRQKAMEAFPVAPMLAQLCASKILRGVAANRAIIIVSRFAWFFYILYRIAPSLVIRISGRMFSRFRVARISD